MCITVIIIIIIIVIINNSIITTLLIIIKEEVGLEELALGVRNQINFIFIKLGMKNIAVNKKAIYFSLNLYQYSTIIFNYYCLN